MFMFKVCSIWIYNSHKAFIVSLSYFKPQIHKKKKEHNHDILISPNIKTTDRWTTHHWFIWETLGPGIQVEVISRHQPHKHDRRSVPSNSNLKCAPQEQLQNMTNSASCWNSPPPCRFCLGTYRMGQNEPNPLHRLHAKSQTTRRTPKRHLSLHRSVRAVLMEQARSTQWMVLMWLSVFISAVEIDTLSWLRSFITFVIKSAICVVCKGCSLFWEVMCCKSPS